MGTIEQLTQLGFTPNQSKHLGINGVDLILEGWLPATLYTSAGDSFSTDTWDYLSSGSVTIPTGGEYRYAKGQKVRFKQGGSYKYFSIIAVTDTTLAFALSSDYSVANAAITDIYVSSGNPLDFPQKFNWTTTTSTPTGSWTAGTIEYATFSVDQSDVSAEIYFAGTLSAGTPAYITFTLPVNGTDNPNGAFQVAGPAWAEDNGTHSTGKVLVMDNSGTARCYKSDNAAFATAGNKFVISNFRYKY